MPNCANNESAVREKIFRFLDAIPDLYRKQICLLANPAAKENGMWGAFLELQQFGLHHSLSIFVHKDHVGNILPPIGAESGRIINLLLIGESNGIGHYSLLIPTVSDQKFTVKPILPTGDCMFDACIQALKILQSPEQTPTDSSFAEIRELRAIVASRLQDADIRALFSNYLLTEHPHSAVEARLRLPHGALMDKAKALRKEYSNAIYFSNMLRDVATGVLDTFNLFVRQELRAQSHHNYTIHNLLLLPTIQPSQIMELLTQIYGTEASQTEVAKIFCVTNADTIHCDFRAAIAIEFLVRKYGVDINAQKNYHDLEQDNSRLTALHCAVTAKDLTAVSVLCRLGADLTIVEQKNLTAIEIAKKISETEHNPAVFDHLSMEANMQSIKKKDTSTTTPVPEHDHDHDQVSDSASDDDSLIKLLKTTPPRKLSFTKLPDSKPPVAEPPAPTRYKSSPVLK